MDIMDARAGLLISHPHLHLLSHKLQSLLLFVGPEEKKGGGKVNISKCSFLLTSGSATVCLNLGFLNMFYLVCLSLHCVANLLGALSRSRGHLP